MPLVIHCADIGSVKTGNFGWARLGVGEPNGQCTIGRDIEDFAGGVAADINAGAQVALGFECPLFLPLSEDPTGLTSARPGEGDRAWSAGAGAAALATGLTETVWVSRPSHATHQRNAFSLRRLASLSRCIKRFVHLGGLCDKGSQSRYASR